MNRNTSIVILGLGNILLGDEGFGVHFVRWFEERYRLPPEVEIVDGGTLGYLLLDNICNCRRLIVIDAIKIDDAPGSVYHFPGEEMALYMPPPTSAHEVTFPDVLLKAELLNELPETMFICTAPKNIGTMNPSLSDSARDRFSTVEGILLKELSSRDITAERIENA